MLAAGHITTLTGILFSCMLCLIILMIYVRGYLHAGPDLNALMDKPANTIKGKNNGIGFMIFMDAIVGNFAAGASASILFSFTLKGNQTRETESSELSDL